MSDWNDCKDVQCQQVHDLLDSLLEWMGVDYPKDAYAVCKMSRLTCAIEVTKKNMNSEPDPKAVTQFIYELTECINRHSKENASNTPDWILANYLGHCLEAFNSATNDREVWYGRNRGQSNNPNQRQAEAYANMRLAEEKLKESTLVFRDAVRIARGCMDYGGGHHDGHLEVYHHGIQTVINALESAEKSGLKDLQSKALWNMGAPSE